MHAFARVSLLNAGELPLNMRHMYSTEHYTGILTQTPVEMLDEKAPDVVVLVVFGLHALSFATLRRNEIRSIHAVKQQ